MSALARMPFKRTASPILAILLIVSCMSTALAESEAAVKAVYILNFAKLVDWPDSSFTSGQSLVIGVIGHDAVGDEVERDLPGLTANGRKIAVRRVSVGDTAALLACHLIFVPESDSGQSVISTVRGHPVLVIGEAENFVWQGGALRFVMEEGTVKFEANPKAAARNGLTLGANLLRVARHVIDR
jgi:hypothetical protein